MLVYYVFALIAAASFVLPVHAQEGSVSVSAQAAVYHKCGQWSGAVCQKCRESAGNGKAPQKIMTALLTLEEAAERE